MSYNKQWRGQPSTQNYRGRNTDRNYKDNVKKSGAVYSRIKKGVHEGETSVNAWRKTKNGLMTASAFPVDKNDHESKDGTKYQRYVVEVVNRDLGTTQTYWCLMNKSNKKIFIKELGLVISPNGNGVTSGGKRVTGFFGKVFN